MVGERKIPSGPCEGIRRSGVAAPVAGGRRGNKSFSTQRELRPGIQVSAGLPVARRSGESFRPGRSLSGWVARRGSFGRPSVSVEFLALSVSTQSRS